MLTVRRGEVVRLALLPPGAGEHFLLGPPRRLDTLKLHHRGIAFPHEERRPEPPPPPALAAPEDRPGEA